MNPTSTDQSRKSNPWKSGFLILGAAIAGPIYSLTQVATIAQKSKGNAGASEAERESIFIPLLANVSKVVGSNMALALIAGIVNVVLVITGERKWTLAVSVIGILISLGDLGTITVGWLSHGGRA